MTYDLLVYVQLSFRLHLRDTDGRSAASFFSINDCKARTIDIPNIVVYYM